MDPGNQNFCLKWNNHKTNMIDVFEELRQNENFTDLTFVLDTGEKLKCHQIVLAACSGFIQENCHMIAPIDQFIIILSKETRFKDLVALITYIYRGEVNVTAEDLPEFLKLAESLQIKGLNGLTDSKIEPNVQIDEEQPLRFEITSSTPSTSNMSSRNEQNQMSPSTSRDNLYSSLVTNHNLMHNPGFWNLPAFPFPQHGLSSYHSQLSALSRSYEQSTSPLMKKKLSSMMANMDTPILRTVLGKNNGSEHEARQKINTPINESNRRYSSDFSRNESISSPTADMEDEDRQISPPKKNSNYNTPAAREWKRYKQYTREDINNAIMEVKQGGLSALKAARKYKVPSRTLYDKVKKLGIRTNRNRRSSSANSHVDNGSAQFPFGIGGNVNGSIYRSSYSSLEEQSPLIHSRQTSPSPVIENLKENENFDNMVEDLSIKSRKEASSEDIGDVSIKDEVSS